MTRSLALPDVTPPPTIAWLVDLIGETAAMALIEAEGGRRLRLPVRVRGWNRIVELVGEEAARRLVRSQGGNIVKLPMCKTWLARVRYVRGASYREIAARLRVDESTVHRWVSGRTGDGRTGRQSEFLF